MHCRPFSAVCHTNFLMQNLWDTTLKTSEMERAQCWGLRLLIVIFHDSLNYGAVTYRAYLWKKKSLHRAPCS